MYTDKEKKENNKDPDSISSSNLNQINPPRIFHSLQFDDITVKKKLGQSSDDEFQVIDNEEITKSKQMMKNYSLFETKQIYPSYPADKNQLIQNTIVSQEPSNKQNTSNSVWSSFTNKISNITNNLKYNIITTNSSIKFNTLKYVRILDKVFSDLQIQAGELESDLQTIFHFTYRSDFLPIVYEGNMYTSDCGWGCMIRVAQMMLSKCILENKIYNYTQLKKNIYNSQFDQITEDKLNKLKYRTLLLFFDNAIKVEDVSKYQDFAYLKKNMNSLSEDLENNNGAKVDENTMFHSTEISAPFSIQNVCKLGALYGKGAGIWFSDVMMIGIFCEINKQFDVIPDIEMISFNDGIIDEETIYNSCFEELQCREECKEKQIVLKVKENNDKKREKLENYEINQIDEFMEKLNLNESPEEDDSDTYDYHPACPKCQSLYFAQEENKDKLIKNENTGKLFKFKKSGTIFVSVRLGLEYIPKKYFDSVSHIFKIPNNLGIIGGRKNSALYFIGEYMDRLIYLDPHVNQVSVKDIKSLQIVTNFNTYNCKYFYQTHVGNISPAFTTAFYFRNLSEYEALYKHFNIHSSLSHPVFKFRSMKLEVQEKKKSSKNVAEVVGLEDDFCIIDYK